MAQKNKRELRIGEEKTNYQNDIMKIISYNNANDMVVEFQDSNHGTVHTNYYNFKSKSVKNPYHPEVCDVGMIGNKYPARQTNGSPTKEYYAWRDMLRRCFDEKKREKNPTYKDVVCSDDFLYYEFFYDWLHSQENFDRWLNGKGWAIDKDILLKGNKISSPNNCCLVPRNVNNLFLKSGALRGAYPIGVIKKGKDICAKCQNPFTSKTDYLGTFNTEAEAFLAYKTYKESLIKQVAQEEFDVGNITKKCYNAMMGYEVEITD